MASACSLTIEQLGDRELLITRRFDAPRQLVFAAHTEPALIRQWLLGPGGWTMPVCEVDLQPGGHFRYVWRKGKTEMGLTGRFVEIVPPERLVHTEMWDDNWTAGEALITTTFVEGHSSTVLAVLVRYASPASREQALKTGMTEGMTETYDRLATLLTTSLTGEQTH
jgi:uncharacterized protein YndB with AHSA1/START domain